MSAGTHAMTVHFIGRSQLYPTLTRILCRSEYSKFVSNRADAQQCAEPEELRRNHSQSSRPRRLQKFCAMSASDTVPSRLFVVAIIPAPALSEGAQQKKLPEGAVCTRNSARRPRVPPFGWLSRSHMINAQEGASFASFLTPLRMC